VELNVVDTDLVGDVDEIKPGKTARAYFYTKDLKQLYLSNPKATIRAYCVEQTGKRFHVNVSKELVLSTMEPID